VDVPKLSRREVIRRLRERGEPITLFAENELEAFKRLRKLEILEPEVNRGFRNDLQAAYEQVDQAYLEEMLKTTKPDSSGPHEKKKLGDVHVQEDDYEFHQIFDMAKEAFSNKKDLEGHAQMILKWLKFLLKTWGQRLNAREEHEKLHTRGKLASATYTQTVVSSRAFRKDL
jgi:pre-mRNA-splicing factor 18